MCAAYPVAQEVKANNEYSAAVPGHKQYVVDGLQKTAQKLKTDTVISWGSLKKSALEPLRALAKQRVDGTWFRLDRQRCAIRMASLALDFLNR